MTICKECGAEFFNHCIKKDFEKFNIGDIVNNTHAGNRNPIKISVVIKINGKRITTTNMQGDITNYPSEIYDRLIKIGEINLTNLIGLQRQVKEQS